jgi:hypothetical protein
LNNKKAPKTGGFSYLVEQQSLRFCSARRLALRYCNKIKRLLETAVAFSFLQHLRKWLISLVLANIDIYRSFPTAMAQ